MKREYEKTPFEFSDSVIQCIQWAILVVAVIVVISSAVGAASQYLPNGLLAIFPAIFLGIIVSVIWAGLSCVRAAFRIAQEAVRIRIIAELDWAEREHRKQAERNAAMAQPKPREKPMFTQRDLMNAPDAAARDIIADHIRQHGERRGP